MAKQKSGLQKDISSIFEDETDLLNDEPQQTPEVRPQVQASPAPPKPKPTKPPPPGKIKTNNRIIAKLAQVEPRQRKMVVFMGVLAIIFTVVMVRALVPGLDGPRASDAAVVAPAEEEIMPKFREIHVDWQRPDEFVGLPRNPMLPTRREMLRQPAQEIAQEIARPGLKVTGIIYSMTNPSVVINGQIFHQGDVVSGATIVTIGRRTIDFEMSGQEWQQSVQWEQTKGNQL